MALMDDDDEMSAAPLSVNNYHFVDGGAAPAPIPFSVLPLHFPDSPAPAPAPAAPPEVFLHGVSDGGLQKVFKQVIAYRLDLAGDAPVISVLGKDGKWAGLEKPRKIYEEVTGRTVLVTVHALHFLRRNLEASEKSLWAHLNKVFSFEDKPSEDDFKDHSGLIHAVMERDERLAKCPLLPLFLKERCKKRVSFVDDPASKNKFIADDDEADEGSRADDGDDSEEEEPDLFDSVCAICDNGGELLCCEGRCLRSFHATKSAGEDSDCKSLGYSKIQVEALQNFLCRNCKVQQHQCFACGKIGSSDKSGGTAEVFICVKATCGHFYHPKCVSRLLYRGNGEEASDCQRKIEAGESFTCPLHKCVVCDKGENKEVVDMQFAMCRRCPKAYHRKCLPREIAFDDIEEEDIVQRAWDDLLPKRILIYCLDHEMDEELGTPIRNHIRFPESAEDRKLLLMQKNRVPVLVKKKHQDSDSPSMKSRIQGSGLPLKRKHPDYDKLPMDSKPKKEIQQKLFDTEAGSKREKTIVRQVPESYKKMRLSKDGKADGIILAENKRSLKEKTKLLTSTVPSTSVIKKSSFPVISEDTEKRMKALMEAASSSITMEGILKKRTIPSTHAQIGRMTVDKSITQGKVEGAVEAVRAAIKKLENGGTIEDAKAVCEPEVLKQLFIWNNKLKVYLAPFLHGVRYSSFGRHFTQVDKLKEIVDKLQCYVQSGDTIVDFCCGSNDFSLLMKEKLDTAGKKCSFKNFDIIQPKNDFCFEKRDWMTVQMKDLPIGSQLIMGLNPPFGVKAALANKFIDKALMFRPKLIVLIVPPETERLDKKKTRYDLIWEDREKLAGKSFYLPGSVDVNDKQIEQWNNTPPPLYLWSRSDWTAKHMAIASKQGHLDNEEIKETPSEDAPLAKKMEGPPVEEHTEVHENRDATLGAKIWSESNKSTVLDNTETSAEIQRKKSRKSRGKKPRKEEAREERKMDVDSDMSISPKDDNRNSTSTTALDEDIDQIAKRYAAPSSRDVMIQSTEETFPSYIRDDAFSRKPSMNNYDAYAQSRYSFSGLVPTSGQLGRYSSPSFGLGSTAAGSSAMQRYAPRFDETNYLRPGNLPPAGSLPDTAGFAPPPRHTYPRPGSSGWLND